MKHLFNIARDKWLHFWVSALIVFLILGIFRDLTFALFISLLIGVGKEVLDELEDKGCADIWDIVADLVGIGFAWIVVLLWRIII